MKYVMLFLKRYKGRAVLAVILLLGQVVGTLLIPALIADVVDRGILQGDMQVILRVGIQMLAAALLAAGVAAWASWVTSDLSALFGREMRSRLLRKSQELSIQQFDAVGISSMVTRATSDITNLQQTMGMMLQMAAPAPIIAVVSVVMTAAVSPVMAVIQLSFMAVLLVLSAAVLKKSNALSRTIQERLDRINLVLREAITGVRVIRAFGNERHEEARSGRAYQNYAGNMIRLNKLFAVFIPAVWLLMGALIAVVLGIGGTLTLGGEMEVGRITAVTEYSTLTMGYLIMAAAAMTTLPKARSCLKRLQELLDAEPSVSDTAASGGNTAESAAAVEFEHVTFSYPGAEEPVIRDLSFKMYPGQTTAVVGSTGSGKSTLADLLLRLHDTDSGRIRLGGKDVRELTQMELRDRIGCVPQKAFLFSGTIAENLRMGRLHAADGELWDALRVAQAEGFVKRLPQGLEAPVAQGGTNFSGGQRQRLSIARALVKKADVFLFDDSFSALDVKTDAALRRALRQNVIGPAKLIIAQRISTILNADQILVMDKGRLAGAGTHCELLQKCPVYRAIADSQMNRKEA